MKKILIALMLMALVIGCSNEAPDYTISSQPQEQGQYVGGGCGLVQIETNMPTHYFNEQGL